MAKCRLLQTSTQTSSLYIWMLSKEEMRRIKRIRIFHHLLIINPKQLASPLRFAYLEVKLFTHFISMGKKSIPTIKSGWRSLISTLSGSTNSEGFSKLIAQARVLILRSYSSRRHPKVTRARSKSLRSRLFRRVRMKAKSIK